MSGIALRIHGETHAGNVREGNEDTLLVDQELGLFAVLDGMGGHMAGDVASSKARDVIHERVRAGRSTMDPRLLLVEAINRASAAVHAEATSRRDRHGMGTTAVALLMVDDSHAVLAHVGDSRAYLMREGRMQLLTRDHTVVAELIANGAISPDEANHHPYKSVLSRNLGAKPEARPDLLDIALQPGDRVLLCSDGLTGFASSDAVEQILGGVEDPINASRDLIELALRGGGGDNVTVVVVEAGRAQVPRSTQIIRTTGSAEWWRRRDLFLDAAANHGLAGSPICAVLSPEEAVEIVAGNLCEAIYHDLEHTTGLNVWTYAENLGNGWLDQEGDYGTLRQLLDTLRIASMEVIGDIGRQNPELGTSLETAVIRSFAVAEMAVAGLLAERLRTVELGLIELEARARRERPITEQPTVPYMRAMRVDAPPPEVAAFLGRAIRGAQEQLMRLGGRVGADDCLQVVHKVCVDPVGDASLAARELYAGRSLEEAGISVLLEAVDTARAVHLEAIRREPAERPVRAAAMRRACVAHQRLYCALSRLLVEAGQPISDGLHQAAEETARLRAQLGQGEAKLAKLERMLVTSVDGPAGVKKP
ncbi:MAG TPA: PP2C family serine/threonine-protein phosphatase [Kofleriaceae bacterium]|nr:PP2C family serine/threonine-protein phosphatase [Kofleriaceae bacterium]